jgi:hypothetical protein
MTTENTTHWADSAFASERAASRACVQDWLTGTGPLSDVPLEKSPDALTDELLASPDARYWISIVTERDEHGEEVARGPRPYLQTREQIASVIGEVQQAARAARED